MFTDGLLAYGVDGAQIDGPVGLAPDAEFEGTTVVDIAVGSTRVAVATCCEPVSGMVYSVDREGGGFAQFDQGSRVDLGGPTDIAAVGDMAGFVKLTSSLGRSDLIASGIPLVDVAIRSDGEVSTVYVLVNQEFSDALGALVGDVNTTESDAVIVYELSSEGWVGETVLSLTEPACRIDVDPDGLIAVLVADELTDPPGECTGRTVRVYKGTELLDEWVLAGPAAQDISVGLDGVVLVSAPLVTARSLRPGTSTVNTLEGIEGLAAW